MTKRYKTIVAEGQYVDGNFAGRSRTMETNDPERDAAAFAGACLLEWGTEFVTVSLGRKLLLRRRYHLGVGVQKDARLASLAHNRRVGSLVDVRWHHHGRNHGGGKRAAWKSGLKIVRVHTDRSVTVADPGWWKRLSCPLTYAKEDVRGASR